MTKPTLPALKEQIFDRLPAGHILHLQRINMHAPHLRAGEFAVVDTNDKEIVFGELYLVQQSSGPFIWQINRSRFKTDPKYGPCAMLSPLRKIRFGDAVAQANRRGTNLLEIDLSDGPVIIEALKQQILGRVVGIYQGPDIMRTSLPDQAARLDFDDAHRHNPGR